MPVAEPVRLAKRVAAQVPCSRREAEQFIEGGWVRVDGVVVDAPESRVADHQQVTVDAKADLSALAPATLLLHRPPGLSHDAARALLVPQNHWTGDPDAAPLLRHHLKGLEALLHLHPDAEGLAVFSQDRRILRKLHEDAGILEQELVVEVAGGAAPEQLARVARGLVWNNQPLPPCKVSWSSDNKLRFAMKGIDPALVPWMCGQIGLQVKALRRIRLGRVPMAGLPPGQWRWLQPHERF
jgi:23S rRNA pseudouridine2604 synthase